MSFIPTAKGFLNNMDLLVAQPPVNHSLTLKPPDYKNNGSHATVINLLSNRTLSALKCPVYKGFQKIFIIQTQSFPVAYWSDRRIRG